jgi:hypothetical protein
VNVVKFVAVIPVVFCVVNFKVAVGRYTEDQSENVIGNGVEYRQFGLNRT